MKQNSTHNDLSIFVAFHISNDSSTELSQKIVETSMYELFKNESNRLVKSENDNGFEIIYKIQQPLLVSNDKDNETFFNKLHKLFEKTSEMLPHFTQVDSEELDNIIESRKHNLGSTVKVSNKDGVNK